MGIRDFLFNTEVDDALTFNKGQRVGIDGRLRSRSWEEEGKRRTVVEVVAHRVDFLSAPRRDGDPVPDELSAEVIPFEAASA